MLLLVGACASVNQTTMDPKRYFDGTALTLAKAIQQNQLDEVKQFARQVELNKLYREDMTPLMWAMAVNQQEAFRLLLQAGADPNLKDKDGTQPVGIAAGANDNNLYLTILLQSGGNPNSMHHTEPALHVAFDSEYYQNVDLLLAAGANINSRDRHGNTILIKAGYQEKFEKAIDLINKGADIHAVASSGGGIALEVQESTPKVGSPAYQAQARLKKLLVGRGIKFPIPDPSAKPYAELLMRWSQTPEGQTWQQKRRQLADDPMGFGSVWVETDRAAFAAFKAWMKANDIPEPAQPRAKAIGLNE
ncbi:ankyrin repeat domain-containing protein [uncultured Fibrella sp.]|uniref:ankyrin repeat domain-containing protein n=1 Tax=uncultured Fibrella sp. TaxID=1284596 RepID=UPI0035CB4668